MITIRLEEENEYQETENVIREAFWNRYVPGCSEHYLMHVLRSSDSFIKELDFVAVDNNQIVGQIMYTKAVIEGQGKQYPIITFGPVGVLPSYQKQGVGSLLINTSIAKAKELGYKAIVIMGDPRYYHRFGFRCGEKYDIKTAEGKYAVALQALELEPGWLINKGGYYKESKDFLIEEKEVEMFDAHFPSKKKEGNLPCQQEFLLLCSLQY